MNNDITGLIRQSNKLSKALSQRSLTHEEVERQNRTSHYAGLFAAFPHHIAFRLYSSLEQLDQRQGAVRETYDGLIVFLSG